VHLVAVGEKIVGICHPCKIYGAMAVARPILSLGPPECHVADILADNNIGWTIQHGDLDRAEQIVRQIYSIPSEMRMKMGCEALRLVNQKYGKLHLCGRFVRIVQLGPQADSASEASEIKALPALNQPR
jgi:hypothetical protein